MHDLIPAEAIDDPDFTTGQRCALIADLIEQDADAHDQEVWVRGVPGFEDRRGVPLPDAVRAFAGTGSCGTAGCVAGWAIAAAPESVLDDIHAGSLSSSFQTAPESEAYALLMIGSSRALGFDTNLMGVVSDALNERSRLVELLRWASGVPEAARTPLQALDGLDVDDGVPLDEWLHGQDYDEDDD